MKPAKNTLFYRFSAQRAQPLSVLARAATDQRLRQELAQLITAMPMRLRCQLVDMLPIKQVERLRLAMQEAARQDRP